MTMTTRGEDMPELTRCAADPVHDGTVSPELPAPTEDAGPSRQHATMAVQHDSAVTEVAPADAGAKVRPRIHLAWETSELAWIPTGPSPVLDLHGLGGLLAGFLRRLQL